MRGHTGDPKNDIHSAVKVRYSMSCKQAIREQVWTCLEEAGVARFPFPVADRIPNFAGASDAADRVRALSAWADADAVKANPDYAQFPVRVTALEDDKDVYVAVPRLADEQCFVYLEGSEIDEAGDAATLSGIDEHGTPVLPSALPTIDLIVVGSVAVTTDGARIGKGEGYSDLEYAILREFERIDSDTPVVTTVHDHQVVDPTWEPDPHDVPIDWILTPERSIDTDTPFDAPTGIEWSLLSEKQRDQMPVLDRLAS